ncbi:YjbQ family protein [bacterium]|nr:YjbQ family protein [candidate division CSSED10-310 bacterium]
MERFSIQTDQRETVVDITGKVRDAVKSSGIREGICIVYIPHTTAGVTINENADPSVKADIRSVLMKLVPEGRQYRHLEGNADSHVKATMTGSSVSVIVESGVLQLGTWQGIQFCEFDGPRTRQVWVKILGAV